MTRARMLGWVSGCQIPKITATHFFSGVGRKQQTTMNNNGHTLCFDIIWLSMWTAGVRRWEKADDSAARPLGQPTRGNGWQNTPSGNGLLINQGCLRVWDEKKVRVHCCYCFLNRSIWVQLDVRDNGPVLFFSLVMSMNLFSPLII
jgi:hypothetical protein